MSGKINLRLPRGTLERIDEIARSERKDRSTLIREILEDGLQVRRINNSVDLYRRGVVTGWRAASLAGISLRRFYDELKRRGVYIQYGPQDLEDDLKALRGLG
jgi:predicted HTH domain antitoxin